MKKQNKKKQTNKQDSFAISIQKCKSELKGPFAVQSIYKEKKTKKTNHHKCTAVLVTNICFLATNSDLYKFYFYKFQGKKTVLDVALLGNSLFTPVSKKSQVWLGLVKFYPHLSGLKKNTVSSLKHFGY